VNLKYWSSIYCIVILLTACSSTDNASIELSGLNYTNVGIADFSVNDYGGHGIEPNGGGGKFVCCVTVSRNWNSGMKVTVRWTEDAAVPSTLKERVVDVPKYKEQDIGSFVVHFYPGDIVKVLVTTKIVGHPDYPYPRPK
jgi:hypothetical protein